MTPFLERHIELTSFSRVKKIVATTSRRLAADGVLLANPVHVESQPRGLNGQTQKSDRSNKNIAQKNEFIDW